MNITEELLMAYADGELDTVTRAEVERAIANDPHLTKQVANHRALRMQLNNVFDTVLQEPVPESLRDAVSRSAVTQDVTLNIANLAKARAAKENNKQPVQRWAPTNWMSIAASLVMGVLIGLFTFGSNGNNPIVATKDGLIARGELSQALSEELASRPNENSSVFIGISYLAKSGDYCRTFTLATESALAGVACRSDNMWSVQMLVQADVAADTAYRTAASSMPIAVLEQVNRDLSGEPLNAEQEAQIAKRGWRIKGE